jgi:hypothetical protein
MTAHSVDKRFDVCLMNPHTFSLSLFVRICVVSDMLCCGALCCVVEIVGRVRVFKG